MDNQPTADLPEGAPHDMGRPTKLTPEIAWKIVNGIKVCMSKEAAAARAGVTRKTLYNWIERGKLEEEGIYRDFAEDIDLAMAVAEFDQAVDLRKAGKKDWRAIRFMLKCRAPERWTESQTAPDPERPSAVEIAQSLHAMIKAMEATVPRVPPEPETVSPGSGRHATPSPARVDPASAPNERGPLAG